MEKHSQNGRNRINQQANSDGCDGRKKTAAAAAPEAATASGRDELSQIDDIIGHFGPYQLLIFIFKILIGVTSAFNNLGVTFFAPSGFISFWCADSNSISLASRDQQYNSTFVTSNNNQSRASNYQQQQQQQLGNNLLGDFLFSEERRIKHSFELNYDTPKGLIKECSYISKLDNRAHKCTSYEYDTGIWISTIIDEWDLVCDRAWFISLIQSLYMSGFIISFLMFGYLSDRFGRWRSLLLGASIEIASGFGCALSNSVTSFMMFRFLLGLGNAGRSSSSYLIMIEWVGPKWRMHISTLGSMGWVMGYCLMPWITLYFLHFRHMQLFICFYEMIFVIGLLCLPESPRWLLIHKKFDEAYGVLLTAAKFNGLIIEPTSKSPLVVADVTGKKNKKNKDNYRMSDLSSNPPSSATPVLNIMGHSPVDHQVNQATDIGDTTNQILKPYTIDEYNWKFKCLANAIEAKDFTQNENKLSFIDLFRWNNLRRYAFILFFVWAANSFIYYGIALRVGDFGGKNLFIAFTIAGLTELPSIAFTIICMKLLPRRTTNLFIFITCGLLCGLQLPLKYYNNQWLQQTTMMLAKLFNSCSFTVILYQTMELFPTSIRQTAYSSCSLAGRIGSILAPFIKELAQVTNESVPPVIYAALCTLAALLIRELPETRGSDLPDTLLEAENFKGTDRRSGARGGFRSRSSSNSQIVDNIN